MTLTSTTLKNQYAGDGSTVSFSVTFVFWDSSDLRVVLTNDSTGTETEWTEGTQYEVSGGDGGEGTLTVNTSPTDYTPASGETLTIISNRDDTQPTSLPLGGEFPSTSVEQALDQAVRLVQQLVEEVGRCLKLPVSTASSVSTDLPAVDTDAPIIQLKTDGTGFEFISDSPGSAAAAAASAAAAETWAKGVVGINNQTDDCTLAMTDVGKLIEMEKGTAVTLTVPPNSSVAFDVDTVIVGVQYGAGQVTIAPGSGVTLRSANGALKTVSQYSQFSLTKRGTNEWLVAGDLEV